MPATLVGFAAAASSSIALPAHQAGDLIIITAHRNSTSLAARPAGWSGPAGAGADGVSVIWGWKIAESNAEVSGTWTSANHLIARVWRGASGVGATAVANVANDTVIPIPGVTLQGSAASSILDRFAVGRLATSLSTPANHALAITGGAGTIVTKLFTAPGSEAGATSTLGAASGAGRAWTVEILSNAGITGQATGSISLAGVATGSTQVAGTGSGALPLTGVSEGHTPSHGQAAGNLDLAGQGEGRTLTQGQVDGLIDLSGAAIGTMQATGVAFDAITLSGSAQGVSEISDPNAVEIIANIATSVRAPAVIAAAVDAIPNRHARVASIPTISAIWRAA